MKKQQSVLFYSAYLNVTLVSLAEFMSSHSLTGHPYDYA